MTLCVAISLRSMASEGMWASSNALRRSSNGQPNVSATNGDNPARWPSWLVMICSDQRGLAIEGLGKQLLPPRPLERLPCLDKRTCQAAERRILRGCCH